MKNYTFDEFKIDIKNLKLQKPDAIIAIARGGLTFAHHLSQKLDIRDVFSINAISYEGNKKVEDIKIFNIPNLDKYKNILIVDDISDSGDTFIKVLNILKNRYPEKTFKTISLFYKPTSKYKPDIYLHTANEWINFFWEDLNV